MIITGIDAYRMGIVENLLNEELQIQPAGIELTLNSVEKFIDAGIMDLTNEFRRVSRTEPIPFDNEEKIFLAKGVYRIKFNEVIKIPENVVAIGYPRSSLIRSGVTIYTAIWDPGYIGRSECLLCVFNDNGVYLYRNARLLQLIFIKIEGKPHKIYNGKYQKENI
ncbi:MAG: deoxyuridine 5'-triphosphate nucleotidohydrolase [Candidatus Methanomethylicia archaeon]|nr:deoxyuridine 5'-triphosphate nucleotidohydrolase [Candidatus Methanomethylicia archaeon]MCX8168832.1 deoxyuridine 5'-triphosphate nucleotidohydrolase [Candidatus Methanomethylicia archaeon]MDW7988564.1 deoxyuridine 5'-triphosphate nucleotidohydrolase [Nitrososphaerota archaeon]